MDFINNSKYNIKNIFLYSFSCFFVFKGNSQNIHVVRQFKEYCSTVSYDYSQRLVELRQIIPGLIYDLRYATKQNFTGRNLYENTFNSTYLRLPVALALKKVEEELEKYNYSLKIFDAYRPYSVTKRMWVLIHDDRYVANPATGSGHNRGLAVDLTLVNRMTGKELNMGTNFDNFTDTAHLSFKKLPTDIIKRRELLKSVMELYGFKSLESEWWHYSWPNNKNYDVLDLNFKTLARKSCR
ncbi:MAG: M15 family metallopeptidase [Candidatus Dadabacteria bacterium]